MQEGETNYLSAIEVQMQESHRYPGLDQLNKLIGKAAAVSFDFFDTLFLRPLADPEDAFQILAGQFDIPDFPERRRAAQTEAFRRMGNDGRKEITLKDIYTCAADMGLPADELMTAEYQLELKLLEPNPELVPLLRELLDAGKPVVITSDMYLSGDFFKEALRPYGLAHVPLFISADYNATKRDSGELFDHVATGLAVPAQDILHVGDNPVSDVVRAREKGLMAFHYRMERQLDAQKGISLGASIGHGLLKTRALEIRPDSFAGLGYTIGGPANVGFLQWIANRCRIDAIDYVLFLSRDGYCLDRIAREQLADELPDFCYFFGSRTAYALAAMTADNFVEDIPFLISGADGLTPCELLERIGVQPPSPKVMSDIGLGSDQRIDPALYEKMASFLYAYRWEILKVCRRNRRALYYYLMQLGLKSGSRVALVDVGWSGSTQAAFEKAVLPVLNLEVFGYYFCLPHAIGMPNGGNASRKAAMFNGANTPRDALVTLYHYRVIVEQFFSAPHDTIIGLDIADGRIRPVMDAGRVRNDDLNRIADNICRGVQNFATHFNELQRRLDLKSTPHQIAWSLIDFVTHREKAGAWRLLSSVKNFDAWGSSRNRDLCTEDYL